MARMIPAQVPTDTPYSERRVFDLLRSDPATEEWTVLHSIGLRRTAIGPYGEIDLVVLIPGRGLVCLEVKGGDVSCSDGQWQTRNRATGVVHRLKKSPYLQARENMFALKKLLENEFGALEPASKCATSYAVVFPDVFGIPFTPESEVYETIDAVTLRKPLSLAIERNINQTRTKVGHAVRPESVSGATLTKILKFLRPDFDRVIARSTLIHATEQQLIKLTQEQYDYLDIASVNDRALVEGAAGTGKTLLALEYARRESAQGRRVLMLCFNRILARWLERQLPAASPGSVVVSTFHAFLRNAILSSSYRDEFERSSEGKETAEMFGDLCPLYGELAILEREISFDTLIVDEAQDLLTTKSNIAPLGALLRGGMSGGRWAIFGDFTRQAIYGARASSSRGDDGPALLRSSSAAFPVVPLRLNCRNSRQIGEETALLSGFESLPYRLATVHGLPVDYRYCNSPKDQTAKISAVIAQLLKDRVSSNDIVILSPHRFENSAVAEIDLPDGVGISQLREDGLGEASKITFATVHSFKGMESPVLILTGFSNIASEEQQSLLYVGMSRARSHLILILPESVKAMLPRLLKRKLASGWQ